jgi:hypothetical protein
MVNNRPAASPTRSTRRRFVGPILAALLLCLGIITLRTNKGGGLGWGGKTANPGHPQIDLWYGSEQWFGRLGTPQQWVNVLGSVSSPAGIASLRYSLNGGSSRRLGIGPDERRLASAGDFNIELDVDDLHSGPNLVSIAAVDNNGSKSVKTVSVHYSRDKRWPMPYSVHWSAVRSIQEAAQVVDGLWRVEDNGIRPAQLWYDRIVAMGDLTWADYEVTVPVTIHAFDPAAYKNPNSSGPMVGLVLHWKGHYDSWTMSQPRYVAWPFGALCLYGWRVDPRKSEFRLEIQSDKSIATDQSTRKLELGVRYIFKARAESRHDQTCFYRFKVWQDGTPEPEAWDLGGPGSAQEHSQGSMLLIAHHTDVTFGDVAIKALTPPSTPMRLAGTEMSTRALPQTVSGQWGRNSTKAGRE